VLLEHYKFNII